VKFRKKPVVIEAIKFTGENFPEINEWANVERLNVSRDILRDALQIDTAEGTMTASIGDWIIRGVKGEYYPCKPDIFEATYDEVMP
jgi:hypothetical protein